MRSDRTTQRKASADRSAAPQSTARGSFCSARSCQPFYPRERAGGKAKPIERVKLARSIASPSHAEYNRVMKDWRRNRTLNRFLAVGAIKGLLDLVPAGDGRIPPQSAAPGFDHRPTIKDGSSFLGTLPELKWLSPDENPWHVRVLDMRPFTQGVISTSTDPQMAANSVSW